MHHLYQCGWYTLQSVHTVYKMIHGLFATNPSLFCWLPQQLWNNMIELLDEQKKNLQLRSVSLHLTQDSNKYSIHRTLRSIATLNIHDCTNYPPNTSVIFTCNEYFCQPLRRSIQDQVFDSFHMSSMCFGHHVEHFTKILMKKYSNRL